MLKLRIFDCRGLHDMMGVTTEDVRLIVDGHIKHGYMVQLILTDHMLYPYFEMYM
jgi:hypothetical protein